MNLSLFKTLLSADPELTPHFTLPSGWELEEEYQLSEVGYFARRTVTCAGTVRQQEAMVLRLSRSDVEGVDRQDAGAFLQRLQDAIFFLPPDDLELLIEYDEALRAPLAVSFAETAGACIYFNLAYRESPRELSALV